MSQASHNLHPLSLPVNQPTSTINATIIDTITPMTSNAQSYIDPSMSVPIVPSLSVSIPTVPSSSSASSSSSLPSTLAASFVTHILSWRHHVRVERQTALKWLSIASIPVAIYLLYRLTKAHQERSQKRSRPKRRDQSPDQQQQQQETEDASENEDIADGEGNTSDASTAVLSSDEEQGDNDASLMLHRRSPRSTHAADGADGNPLGTVDGSIIQIGPFESLPSVPRGPSTTAASIVDRDDNARSVMVTVVPQSVSLVATAIETSSVVARAEQLPSSSSTLESSSSLTASVAPSPWSSPLALASSSLPSVSSSATSLHELASTSSSIHNYEPDELLREAEAFLAHHTSGFDDVLDEDPLLHNDTNPLSQHDNSPRVLAAAAAAAEAAIEAIKASHSHQLPPAVTGTLGKQPATPPSASSFRRSQHLPLSGSSSSSSVTVSPSLSSSRRPVSIIPSRLELSSRASRTPSRSHSQSHSPSSASSLSRARRLVTDSHAHDHLARSVPNVLHATSPTSASALAPTSGMHAHPLSLSTPAIASHHHTPLRTALHPTPSPRSRHAMHHSSMFASPTLSLSSSALSSSNPPVSSPIVPSHAKYKVHWFDEIKLLSHVHPLKRGVGVAEQGVPSLSESTTSPSSSPSHAYTHGSKPLGFFRPHFDASDDLILLTGATSFLGAHVLSKLLEDDNDENEDANSSSFTSFSPPPLIVCLVRPASMALSTLDQNAAIESDSDADSETGAATLDSENELTDADDDDDEENDTAVDDMTSSASAFNRRQQERRRIRRRSRLSARRMPFGLVHLYDKLVAPHLQRLKSVFHRYGLKWRSRAFSNRLVLLPADVTLPHFGVGAWTYYQLLQHTHTIFHLSGGHHDGSGSSAWTSGSKLHSPPYSALKYAFVEATKRVLEFAVQGRRKVLVYASTLEVLRHGLTKEAMKEREELVEEHNEFVRNGGLKDVTNGQQHQHQQHQSQSSATTNPSSSSSSSNLTSSHVTVGGHHPLSPSISSTTSIASSSSQHQHSHHSHSQPSHDSSESTSLASFSSAHLHNLRNGYIQSKWVCENLVRHAWERGAPVLIVRMGELMPNVQGRGHIAVDPVSRLIAQIVHSRVAPTASTIGLDPHANDQSPSSSPVSSPRSSISSITATSTMSSSASASNLNDNSNPSSLHTFHTPAFNFIPVDEAARQIILLAGTYFLLHPAPPLIPLHSSSLSLGGPEFSTVSIPSPSSSSSSSSSASVSGSVSGIHRSSLSTMQPTDDRSAFTHHHTSSVMYTSSHMPLLARPVPTFHIMQHESPEAKSDEENDTNNDDDLKKYLFVSSAVAASSSSLIDDRAKMTSFQTLVDWLREYGYELRDTPMRTFLHALLHDSGCADMNQGQGLLHHTEHLLDLFQLTTPASCVGADADVGASACVIQDDTTRRVLEQLIDRLGMREEPSEQPSSSASFLSHKMLHQLATSSSSTPSSSSVSSSPKVGTSMSTVTRLDRVWFFKVIDHLLELGLIPPPPSSVVTDVAGTVGVGDDGGDSSNSSSTAPTRRSSMTRHDEGENANANTNASRNANKNENENDHDDIDRSTSESIDAGATADATDTFGPPISPPSKRVTIGMSASSLTTTPSTSVSSAISSLQPSPVTTRLMLPSVDTTPTSHRTGEGDRDGDADADVDDLDANAAFTPVASHVSHLSAFMVAPTPSGFMSPAPATVLSFSSPTPNSSSSAIASSISEGRALPINDADSPGCVAVNLSFNSIDNDTPQSSAEKKYKHHHHQQKLSPTLTPVGAYTHTRTRSRTKTLIMDQMMMNMMPPFHDGPSATMPIMNDVATVTVGAVSSTNSLQSTPTTPPMMKGFHHTDSTSHALDGLAVVGSSSILLSTPSTPPTKVGPKVKRAPPVPGASRIIGIGASGLGMGQGYGQGHGGGRTRRTGRGLANIVGGVGGTNGIDSTPYSSKMRNGSNLPPIGLSALLTSPAMQVNGHIVYNGLTSPTSGSSSSATSSPNGGTSCSSTTATTAADVMQAALDGESSLMQALNSAAKKGRLARRAAAAAGRVLHSTDGDELEDEEAKSNVHTPSGSSSTSTYLFPPSSSSSSSHLLRTPLGSVPSHSHSVLMPIRTLSAPVFQSPLQPLTSPMIARSISNAQQKANWATRILPRLYLGSARHAADLKQLEYHGITHIINAADDVPNYHATRFKYLNLLVADMGQDRGIRRVFKDVHTYVHEIGFVVTQEDQLQPGEGFMPAGTPVTIEEDGQNSNTAIRTHSNDHYQSDADTETETDPPVVLVHCLKGANRSVTIMLALLMFLYPHWTLDRAHHHLLASKHCHTCPFEDNRRELLAYERQRFGVNTMVDKDFLTRFASD